MSGADNRSSMAGRWAFLISMAVSPAAYGQTAESPATSGKSATPQRQELDRPVESPPSTATKPRLEFYVPSVHRLIAETKRSRAGLFLTHLGNYVREWAGASAEGMDAQEADAIVEAISRWPDTSLSVASFAPDTEGQLRWSVRLGVSLVDLLKRVGALLASDAARETFLGVTLEAGPAGVFVITLPDGPIAYLLPAGNAQSIVASHKDLVHPAALSLGSGEEGASNAAPLLSCRLHLANTEQDSGGTVFSSFSAVTAVDYTGRVDSEGQWIEQVRVHWPTLSGMAIKAFFGRVKNTFFVPDAALGSAVFSFMAVPPLLESLAGLGPQVLMDEGGEMTVLGEPTVGPIAKRIKNQVCLSVLPGTGFLPFPDIVVQARVKRVASLEDDMRDAVQRINALYRERDQREPWHEEQVADRTVFWSEGAQTIPGAIMPMTLRPVVFVTRETDARDKERNYLVLAFTSTSPQRLVRRWLDMPRSRERHILPTGTKSNGQIWVNWDRLYQQVHPYFDFGLSIVSTDALLPSGEEVRSSLTDALLTADTNYTGMTLDHEGPIPIGVMALPLMAGGAAVIDESGGSDLARERLASRRLKVLYHHSKLFHKDLGRWPAEVAELDGYIDFAGNPRLLELELSSRKRWSDWIGGIFDTEEEAEEEEEDETESEIDDDLFVIDWGRTRWTLGIAPGTLEHLDKLYIDQDGDIHRLVKQPDDAGQADVDQKGVVEAAGGPERRTSATP